MTQQRKTTKVSIVTVRGLLVVLDIFALYFTGQSPEEERAAPEMELKRAMDHLTSQVLTRTCL